MQAAERKARELLEKSLALSPAARQAFVEELRKRDAEVARVLACLMEAERGREVEDVTDSAHVGFHFQEPPAAVQTDAQPGVQTTAASKDDDPTVDVLERLASREHAHSRYSLRGKVARGGQGTILRVWDEDLRRDLAMKVVLEDSVVGGTSDTQSLARFLEEAQVTGQLDHPGIVPVHELGIDAEGRLYFTMKLVEGNSLADVFGLVRRGAEGWTLTRALGVILRVCEATAYAHAKGVIHRDLKPANVMVGRFGEVYVMDWGLAYVMGREAPARPARAAEPERGAQIETDVSAQSSLEHPLTATGSILGTPAYMPPEQARGEVSRLDARSDVYAVGAMLYQLLTGQAPYMKPGTTPSPMQVVWKVIQGPPKSIHKLNPGVPVELSAICEKAIERDPDDRYFDTSEMAEDLRAYLERRVVGAYETGAWAELKKWLSRNRALAWSSAAAFLLAIGVLVALTINRSQMHERALEQAEFQVQLAELFRRTVFADYPALEGLIDESSSDSMWPVQPDKISAYEEWLRRAEDLVAHLHPDPEGDYVGHYAHLRELAQAARLPDHDETETEYDRFFLNYLETLVRNLEEFADPEIGLITGLSPDRGWGWGVKRRLEFAREIEERSVTGPEAERAWRQAIASIRDVERCPAYGGLVLKPQLGLVPLWRDESSGLWEFAHLQSGEIPGRSADGRLILTGETCIVLVLLPGGTFRMGAQKENPLEPNFDPDVRDDEHPIQQVALSAFFLSKYEMTQGQWKRLVGRNPSNYNPEMGAERIHKFGYTRMDLSHPVEMVSSEECLRALAWLGLLPPTEAQWEYGARAGTSTVWSTGDRVESLAGAANVSDAFSRANGGPKPPWAYEEFDDGYTLHSPVGSFRANPFGLHDVHGNVREYCRDRFGEYDVYPAAAGTGERLLPPDHESVFVVRGGSFGWPAELARSARRTQVSILKDNGTGVRPARSLEH